MNISPKAKAEFDAIRSDRDVLAFLNGCGIDPATMGERERKYGGGPARYLVLTGAPLPMFDAIQRGMDALNAQRTRNLIPGGNAVDVATVGVATVYFFPRAGEIQIFIAETDEITGTV